MGEGTHQHEFGHETCCIEIDKVVGEVRPTLIAPNVWSLLTNHKPGIGGGKLPNRMLMYLVKNAAGKKTLVVLNGVAPDLEADEPFGAIRRLAAEQDATVGYIFNPGPEHHIALPHYARAFPDARVMVAAGRIQRENPELCGMHNVELMAPGDAVPELASQGFHVHIWEGWMETPLINRIQFRWGAKLGTTEPTMFWHEESGTLLNGGHNWFYWGDKVAFPWIARKIFKMKKGEVTWSPSHYKVFDEARCQESARRVVDWKFHTLLDLHSPEDIFLRDIAYERVATLCQPLIDGDWESLPFGRGELGIPEGTFTGGSWKTYR